MKKQFYLAALAAALVFSGCAKENEIQKNGGLFRIQAGLEEVPALRVAMTDATTSLQLAWEATDAIRVIGNGASEVYDIEAGFSAHNASFTGNVVTTGPFTVLYPGSYASLADIQARALTTQTQTGNGSTAHLQYNAALSGLADYSSIAFTQDFATAQSATLTENSVLKLWFQLPSGITQVSKICLTASSAIFPPSNNSADALVKTLTLNVTDGTVSDADWIFTGYLDLGWPGATFEAGTSLTIQVTTNLGEYTKTITPGAKTLSGGKMYTIKVNDGLWAADQPFAGGNGSETNPYLIANYIHMNNMASVLADDQTIWFKMIDDVDMNPADAGKWAPLNTVSPYKKRVMFDGDGHHIRNLQISGSYQHCGWFAILNGTVENVIFDDPVIDDKYTADGSNHDIGVVCGFAGYNATDSDATISNVRVNHSEIKVNSTLQTGGVGFGAVTGTSNFAHISHCFVDGHTVSFKGAKMSNIHGGLVGRILNTTTIEYCNTRNVTLSANAFIGGLVGYINTAKAVVIDSCSTRGTTITGLSSLGGMVGASSKSCTNLVYKRLDASATVTSTLTPKKNTNIANIGGILGQHQVAATDAAAVTIKDCRSTGTVKGTAYVGGIVGQIVGAGLIEGCRSSATIQVDSIQYGGIVGHMGTNTSVTRGQVKGCVFSGRLQGMKNPTIDPAHFIGGIVGVGYNLVITNCLMTGNLYPQAKESIIGGIIGYCSKTDVRGCEWRGTQSRAGEKSSGAIAGQLVLDVNIENNLVTNAYTTGSTQGGGIAGFRTDDSGITQALRNNLVLGNLTGPLALGGLLGRLEGAQSSVIMTGNLVYCEKFTANRGNDYDHTRSSGLMIGEADGTCYTLLENNFYRSDVQFVDGKEGVADRTTTPLDQTGSYSYSSNPLTWTVPAGGVSYASPMPIYYHPYFGAATTATASAKAQELGWSTEWWDLSGSVPALKNIPSAE